MAVPEVQEILRLLEEGRSREVVDRMEAAARDAPYSATVRVLLAHAYERQERLSDALRAWWSALFLMPTSPVAREAVSRILSAHPELEAAEPMAAGGLTFPPIGSRTQPEVSAQASVPYENLDRLINELQSARIVPDPDFEPEDFVEEEDEGDELVSETLARIYAAQQQYAEAAHVYETLATQQPERAREFRARAQELRGRG